MGNTRFNGYDPYTGMAIKKARRGTGGRMIQPGAHPEFDKETPADKIGKTIRETARKVTTGAKDIAAGYVPGADGSPSRRKKRP